MDSYKCSSDLNAFFQAMSKRINDEETIWKGIIDNTVSATEKVPQVMGIPLKFCVFGSTKERLTCNLPGSNSIGDIDVMAIPDVEDSIIDESIMEYDTKNPVFVRLRGKDHPVLQHCLAENSDYVTTSTLKEFHPKVFGSYASLILKGMAKILANCNSLFPPSLGFKDTYLLENPIGPAFQFNFTDSQVLHRSNVSFTEESVAFFNEHLTEIVAPYTLTLASEQNPTSSDMSGLFDTIMPCISSSGENNDIGTCIKTTDDDNCSDSSNSPRSNEKENHDVVSKNKTKEDEDTDSNACSRDDVHGRVVEHLECLGATAGGLSADNKKEDLQEEDILTDHLVESSIEGLLDMLELFDTILPCISSLGENNDIGTCIKTTDDDNCSDSSNSTSSNEKENHDAVTNTNKTNEDDDTDSNACSKDDVQDRMVEQVECLGATGGLSADKLTLTDEDKENLQDEEILTDQLVESTFGGLFGVSEITNRKMSHQENQPIQGGSDLVPAFEVKGWPEVAGAWTARGRLWPSPDIISKILKSGYHLVVKTPKDSDRQDLDFRLSFSRAELILSSELNDIQRDCYRCFKMYYRSALQQRESKVITSYFFKTILLWTVEETGMEVWNEDNRGCCVMMLLEKLLKSLERKFFPHFFVPEFNLLEEAVVDYSQEVQELADEVKKIYENPMKYFLAIPPYQTNSDISDGNLSEKRLESIEEPSAARKRRILRDLDDRNPCFIEYHDFQNVYQDICRKLHVNWVVQENCINEPEDLVMNCIIANMHSLDITKTEDEMMEFLEDISDSVYQVSAFKSGRNPRLRIISALNGMIEDLARDSVQADMSHDPHPLRDVMGLLKGLIGNRERIN